MTRVLLASALAVAATPGTGATRLARDPSRMDCCPLVACIERTGEIIRGASFGRDAGPFQAVSDTGTTCTGIWRRIFLGIGVAEFNCDWGRVGASVYTWFEPETGTANGNGDSADGAEARFWSGNNLERYFREIDPTERERMACAPDVMLVG